MMQPLTAEELRQLCPKAREEEILAFIAAAPELERAGINTPLRMAHFLAQCCAETGGLAITRENTSWTPAQMCALWPGRFKTTFDPRILACRGDPEALANLAYGTRKELGNIDEGDGYAYRGGGMLQITGRAMYHEAGNAIGVDLESAPDLIEDAVISLNVAIWYWTKHNCNQFADGNYGRAVGNAINRGNPYSKFEPIGFKTRQHWFERAWSIVGEGKPPSSDILTLGAYGPAVERLQTTLHDLGYGVGDVDSVFGPTLARAVVAFKHDHGGELEPGSLVGLLTWAALEEGKPIQVSPDRAQATQADLIAKGSTEVVAGKNGKAIGQVTLYAGTIGAAKETGLLDQTNGLLSQVGMFKITAVPALEAISWALGHLWPVALILAGIWYWTKGHQIILARLKAHQLGFNLFR
jgi:predicted chitinase